MAEACPNCQMGHMKPISATYAQIYGNTLVQAPNVAAWTCDVCGHTVFDPQAIRRIEALISGAGLPPNVHAAPEPEASATAADRSAPLDDAPAPAHPRLK